MLESTTKHVIINEATLNWNISSWKQAIDKLSKARIYYYTCTYEVCQHKQQEEGQKVRQLQTEI